MEQIPFEKLKTDLVPIDTIDFSKISDKPKLLITAVSPEIRSVISLERIFKASSIEKCVLIGFTDLAIEKKVGLENWVQFYDDDLDGTAKKAWEENFLKCKEILVTNKVNFQVIHRSSLDVLEIIGRLIENLNETYEIFFDITSLPKSYILEILRWLPSESIFCIYTVGSHDPREDHYSIGVKKVCPLIGFEGDIRTRNDIMLLILGFEGFRSLSLLNYYEPFRILACLGDSKNNSRDEYLATARDNNKLLLDHHMVLEELISSIEHPSKIVNDLNIVINSFEQSLEGHKLKEYNLFASPLGTKLQAVALYLFWLKHREIQIVYAIPSKRRIGTGIAGETYIFNISKK
jgi:hypothetical protein